MSDPLAASFNPLMIIVNKLLTGDVMYDMIIFATMAWVYKLLINQSDFFYKTAMTFFKQTISKKYKHSYIIEREIIYSVDRLNTDPSPNISHLQNGIIEFLGDPKNGVEPASANKISCLTSFHHDSMRQNLIDAQLLKSPIDPVKYDGMEFLISKITKMITDTKTPNISTVISITMSFNDIVKADAFCRMCHLAGVTRIYAEAEKKRFYYKLIEHNGDPVLSKYDWNSPKTFESIFFKQKKMLIQTLDDFTNKKGRYLPRLQRPHKLCIFIYGEPGGGKSSIIKAIVNYTKRNAVEVSPKLVTTGDQLTNLLFNNNLRTLSSNGSNSYIYHELVPVKSRVICFDDMDANSNDSLKPRDGVVNKLNHASINSTNPISLESDEDEDEEQDKDENKNKNKKDHIGKQTLFVPSSQQPLMTKRETDRLEMNKWVQSSGSIGTMKCEEEASKRKPLSKEEKALKKMQEYANGFKPRNQIQLMDWLGNLDGAMPLDDAIVIICTNRPKEFDGAFVRPGRMDLVIHLDCMGLDEILEMLTFTYPEESSSPDFETTITKLPKKPFLGCELQAICELCTTRVQAELKVNQGSL